MGPLAAAFMASLMDENGVGWARRHVKSTTDTSGVGTRNAIPVSFLENPTLGQESEPRDFFGPSLFTCTFPSIDTSWIGGQFGPPEVCPPSPICSSLPSYPLSSGMTLPTALAAPVEAGMMF